MNSGPAVLWNWPPRTILVAVDFGEASARALAIAGVAGAEFGARIRVVHAERFEPPPYFTLEQMARLEQDRRTAQLEAVEHLSAFSKQFGAGEVVPVVKDQPPLEAILGEAETADLVVMGTHGRRGPGRWWLGSVAERTVRAARVPVLVTRSDAGPIQDVFDRVALVGANGAGSRARACADSLARLGGGAVIDAGTIDACGTEAINAATLVVAALELEKRWSWLTDTTASVLTSCPAPVLFVPVG